MQAQMKSRPMCKQLEGRRMLAATPHLTFIEAESAFSILSAGADVQPTGSERGASVARATAPGEPGRPLGTLVASPNNAVLIVPGPLR